MAVDLTPFDFTQTESLIYQVLLTSGPGTGYAVARSAGLARANAYAALEGLVSKGAARMEPGPPRRYLPEPAPVLLARIVERQGHAVDDLARALDQVSLPPSQTITEITSPRALVQLLGLEVARAKTEVLAVLPSEMWSGLGPALRPAARSSVRLELWSDEEVTGLPVPIGRVAAGGAWPGRPVIASVDGRVALLGRSENGRLTSWWGDSPTLAAAARTAVRSLAGGT